MTTDHGHVLQPAHLRFGELILILAFPLLAPYWFAAMTGRRRWRAISEGAVAAVFSILLCWMAMIGLFLLEDQSQDLYSLLLIVLVPVSYLIGGIGAWLIATRVMPKMPDGFASPRWLKQSSAIVLFALLLLSLTALSTGSPRPLHEFYQAIFEAVSFGASMLGDLVNEFGMNTLVRAAFDMAGQRAWLASLIWLTGTCGAAILTLRTYRAEERRWRRRCAA